MSRKARRRNTETESSTSSTDSSTIPSPPLPVAGPRNKRVDQLQIKDVILEEGLRGKMTRYVVTSIVPGACNRYAVTKAHLIVDGHTNWCCDWAALVTVE